MKNLKLILARFPEYYLIVLVIAAGYTPPYSIMPVALGLMVILVLQLIFKNKITGLAIAGLFILINLYMGLALVSEFNEFPAFNAGARKLLFVGVPLIILNLIMAGLMVYKFAAKGEHPPQISAPSV